MEHGIRNSSRYDQDIEVCMTSTFYPIHILSYDFFRPRLYKGTGHQNSPKFISSYTNSSTEFGFFSLW